MSAADDPRALLDDVLDELIESFGSGDYAGEAALARADYERRRGRVYEDEPLWEEWTQWFLEWYVVERVPAGDTHPLGVRALERDDGGGGESARAGAIRALVRSHRSLFQVEALRADRVELVDLLGGASFSVAEPRAMHGVAKGDVCELRLVGFRGEVRFGRTFCYHPRDTLPAITEHAERILTAGGTRLDVVDFVAGLRVRCERYQLPAVRIYETAPERGAEAAP